MQNAYRYHSAHVSCRRFIIQTLKVWWQHFLQVWWHRRWWNIKFRWPWATASKIITIVGVQHFPHLFTYFNKNRNFSSFFCIQNTQIDYFECEHEMIVVVLTVMWCVSTAITYHVTKCYVDKKKLKQKNEWNKKRK